MCVCVCLCDYVHVRCLLYPSADCRCLDIQAAIAVDEVQQALDYRYTTGWCKRDKRVYLCGAPEYFM